ncbi:MAG: class I SAM-dependent methyltransferase, partial [Bacteroidota bacterium]
KSEMYALEAFKAGESSLNTYELEALGNVQGRSLLHLQCHFGQDTLSLARLGAEVTGVDLSEVAIQKANELTEKSGLKARFIVSDVLALDQILNETFDLVFTSYGVIGWLPDLIPWGEIIAHFLKPGGQFVIAEFHPVVWMFDDDLKQLAYSYFNQGLIVAKEEQSYAGAAEQELEAHCWNHALADVFQALMKAGLRIEDFKEYNYSPYDIFGESVTVPGGFQVKGKEGVLPYIFSIKAAK